MSRRGARCFHDFSDRISFKIKTGDIEKKKKGFRKKSKQTDVSVQPTGKWIRRISQSESAISFSYVINGYAGYRHMQEQRSGHLLLRNRFGRCLGGAHADLKDANHAMRMHTHRFLWRDMDARKELDTCVIQWFSIGDRPSGTNATVALRKTAEMAQERYPQEAQTIID